MDDCVNILKGFTADNQDFNKNAHVKTYIQVVKKYRSHIGRVTGRIKHQQGRLTLLTARLRAALSPATLSPSDWRMGVLGLIRTSIRT